jgi:signal transduction histidine kinase
VRADPTYLDRIVTNLLSNAVKYSPPEMPVEVGARWEEGHVVVEVRDRGVGLTQEEQAQLFTPYYRTESARAQAAGLGLGLYVARALVEAQGGAIRVESALHQGATFSFTLLPAAPDRAGCSTDGRADKH